MVAKKSESDKYVRVAFTMEPELHSSVIEKVKSEKATLSGVISSLLSGWVSDKSTQGKHAQVEDRIQVLEKAVSKLMDIDTYQYVMGMNASDEPVPPDHIDLEEKGNGPGEESINVVSPVDAEITNKLQVVDDSSKETQTNPETRQVIDLDPEGWYAQHEVVKMIDISIPYNTRKGWVSKAASPDKGPALLLTNGENGKKSRIKGASAIEWLKVINST